jgi:hypothetical protein
MKNFPLISLLFISIIFLNSCNKEIAEPAQNADGRDVIYLRIDDKDEFLLEARNKRLHKKTAGKFSDFDKEVIRYAEFEVNNSTVSNFSIYIVPFNGKKAAFQKASITLRFDKQTQQLDTAYLRASLKKNWSSVVSFDVQSDEYKSFYIDTVLDYKLLKWDTEKKIISFSANCTYSRSPLTTPSNPKIYFYFDLNYE